MAREGRTADRHGEVERERRVWQAPVDRGREALAERVEALVRADARPEAVREGLSRMYVRGDLDARDLAVVEAMLEGSPLAVRSGPRLSADPGSAMESGTRDRLESIFGRDLGDIRVHVGPDATGVASALGAAALSAGRDVFVRDAARAGDPALLAHEVTHALSGQSAVALKDDGKATTPAPGSKSGGDKAADEAAKKKSPSEGLTFVKADGTGMKRVYYTADGKRVQRSNGSKAWRNNNPGNIIRGTFAKTHGSIGDDGRFAVFPDEATGTAAITALLKSSSYASLTLAGAIAKWAPPSENDTKKYKEVVEKQTGIKADKVLNTLSDAELLKVAQAIRRHEGWIPGTETLLPEKDAKAAADAGAGTKPAAGTSTKKKPG